MRLDEYQRLASTTAVYDRAYGVFYPALGLNGEAGEVAEHAKKIIRDDEGAITDERRDAIKKELGDVLWYVAAIATDLGMSMGDIAKTNIDKLTSRQKRGVLGGSGDER
jgi:NTP pyrophosphatase (non-canonical NTP hydrolase)